MYCICVGSLLRFVCLKWSMADRESWASTAGVANVMRANRRRDTKPELALRRLLHSRGYRYRVDYQPLPTLRRRADIVFPRTRLAIFVDGCYWHSCPRHGTRPRTHAEYWIPKLARNVSRDRETDALLADAGWLVVRVWEHETPENMAATVEFEIERLKST